MVSQTAFQLTLDFLTSKPVVVVPSAEQVSSDAGLLPFRQLDERIGMTRQFAEALIDRRNVGYIDHSFLEMTRMRVYGILADYADQNDHDVLRSDPIFKLLCDRSIEADDLASQPTLSRFENAIDVRSFFRLRDLLLDQFIASFAKPPRQLTLDIDPFDDPTHGQQQLALPGPLPASRPTPFGHLFGHPELQLTCGAARFSMPPAAFRLWGKGGIVSAPRHAAEMPHPRSPLVTNQWLSRQSYE